MSSAAPPIPPAPSPEPIFPLSVDQYHAMIDAGVLTDDDPVELLEGILVFKMPKNPKHRYVCRKLQKALDAMLPAGYFVQIQAPITLSHSEPEPDAAVIRGDDDDFKTRHPGPAEILLVIEVADSTQRRDRGIKLRSYARAGIAVYWIVDLMKRTIEVYRDPTRDSDTPTYETPQVFGETQSIPVELMGQALGTIMVGSLFP